MSDSFRGATASFATVDIRAELATRPWRPPNYETEGSALRVLAVELAQDPHNMLQKLVETAVDLCRADTAGISLLETHDGVDVFRWEALAGIFASARNNTMPRKASPCGVCIDEDATQLMYLADRCFPALRSDPPFVEALLIPLRYQGRPVGTVWVVMNQFERHFDAEDERLMRALSAFASAGWQLWRANAFLKEEIEERKRAEEELRRAQEQLVNLPAMLMQAQETERRLLARELHDDFSQKLIGLGMQVSALSRPSGESPDAMNRKARELGQKIGGLADDVQRMSRQLHPAILDDLGLEAALKEECLRLSQLFDVPVGFYADDVPKALPGDIALCLLRVAQESLRNAGKHAGAKEISVRLACSEQGIELTVEDTGRGFDREQAKSKGGLGLISMEERVRLLHGDFRIRSRSGVGTEVEVRVPFPKAIS